MTTYNYRETFHKCYEQYKELDGKTFTVVRVIEEADDQHDQEVLPMFVIQIDGQQIEAWPEEVLV
jgi:hypothetical protein